MAMVHDLGKTLSMSQGVERCPMCGRMKSVVSLVSDEAAPIRYVRITASTSSQRRNGSTGSTRDAIERRSGEPLVLLRVTPVTASTRSRRRSRWTCSRSGSFSRSRIWCSNVGELADRWVTESFRDLGAGSVVVRVALAKHQAADLTRL